MHVDIRNSGCSEREKSLIAQKGLVNHPNSIRWRTHSESLQFHIFLSFSCFSHCLVQTFSSGIKEWFSTSGIWSSNAQAVQCRREYKTRTTWFLHLNNTVKQEFPRTSACRENICDGKKWLQNVSLSREQQSTFLELRSRFHLECFIYFNPGREK